MSLIDMNGRLFGKINIIDLMIILFLIFGLIFAGRLIYQLVIPDEKWVVVDFRFDKLDRELANSIKIGYVEKVADKVVAEVLDIEFLQSIDVYTKPVLLKVKLLVKIQNNELIHNKQNLVEGTTRSLTLGPLDFEYGYLYLSSGFILNIDRGLPEEKTERIIEMKFYNQHPWFSDAIKIGSKEINYQNETIAEVISKKVLPHQFIHVTAETGQVLVRETPIRDEITLKLKLYGRLGDDGIFIFKEKRILIGKGITLDLDKSLSLSGVITKIE